MNISAGHAIRAAIVTVMLVACPPIEAAAQTAQSHPTPAVKRWSISVGLAGATSGPEEQMEGAMRSAHFDEPSPTLGSFLSLLFCLFCDLSAVTYDTNPQPSSSSGGLHTTYDVTYRRSDWLALGFVTSDTDLGMTTGNRMPEGLLFVKSRVRLVAPVAYLRLGQRARIGAGPIAAWTKVSSSDSHSRLGAAPGNAPLTYTSTTGGALVTATVESGPSRRVFLALNASYQWIAPVTAGPFTARDGNSSASVPSMRVDLSHGSIGAGLGIRF